MPAHKQRFNKGQLIIQFSVKFPEDNFLTSDKIKVGQWVILKFIFSSFAGVCLMWSCLYLKKGSTTSVFIQAFRILYIWCLIRHCFDSILCMLWFCICKFFDPLVLLQYLSAYCILKHILYCEMLCKSFWSIALHNSI